MYGPLVQIDLTRKGETRYRFTRCNRLWLPKKVAINGAVVDNNASEGGVILGVKIGTQGSQLTPWAISDGYANSHSGYVEEIWVTPLVVAAGQTTLYLATGSDVGLGYGDTDGLSPNVGGGASPIIRMGVSGTS